MSSFASVSRIPEQERDADANSRARSIPIFRRKRAEPDWDCRSRTERRVERRDDCDDESVRERDDSGDHVLRRRRDTKTREPRRSRSCGRC
jgi:hypothetical protein